MATQYEPYINSFFLNLSNYLNTATLSEGDSHLVPRSMLNYNLCMKHYCKQIKIQITDCRNKTCVKISYFMLHVTDPTYCVSHLIKLKKNITKINVLLFFYHPLLMAAHILSHDHHHKHRPHHPHTTPETNNTPCNIK